MIVSIGVTDGARTRDIRLHKPALYQLSYDHQAVAMKQPNDPITVAAPSAQ